MPCASHSQCSSSPPGRCEFRTVHCHSQQQNLHQNITNSSPCCSQLHQVDDDDHHWISSPSNKEDDAHFARQCYNACAYCNDTYCARPPRDITYATNKECSEKFHNEYFRTFSNNAHNSFCFCLRSDCFAVFTTRTHFSAYYRKLISPCIL